MSQLFLYKKEKGDINLVALNLNEKKIPSEQNLRLLSNLILSLSSKVQSAEDKCITEWEPDVAYIRNQSYVTHENKLYVCVVSCSDSVWTPSHFQVLSDELTEIDLDTVKSWLNLSSEELANLQSLIDDTSISTTHTNSSSHIYMAIQDAIAECKDDTLKQIAKKVSGSYKIANTTADIVSADYIYLLSNGTNYDLYVLVDGTATKVGDTNIDLSEYVKTTDLADYMKTSDADGKFATITTVEGTLGNLNALVDTKLTVVTSLPASPSNQETVLYIGNSSGGLKSGGIYQYQVSEWVLISYAKSFTFNEDDFDADSSTDEVSLLPSRRVFNGTKADWDLLSVAEKTQYGATAFTDDEGGVEGVETISLTQNTNSAYKIIELKAIRMGNIVNVVGIVEVIAQMESLIIATGFPPPLIVQDTVNSTQIYLSGQRGTNNNGQSAKITKDGGLIVYTSTSGGNYYFSGSYIA